MYKVKLNIIKFNANFQTYSKIDCLKNIFKFYEFDILSNLKLYARSLTVLSNMVMQSIVIKTNKKQMVIKNIYSKMFSTRKKLTIPY